MHGPDAAVCWWLPWGVVGGWLHCGFRDWWRLWAAIVGAAGLEWTVRAAVDVCWAQHTIFAPGGNLVRVLHSLLAPAAAAAAEEDHITHITRHLRIMEETMLSSLGIKAVG